jgi:uncharacterized protein (DUF1778 family)
MSSENRINVPVRAPRAIHDLLAKAAEDHGMSLADYLHLIADQRLIPFLNEGRSTCINPRVDDAKLIREAAERYQKRQWEVWLELHLLYEG